MHSVIEMANRYPLQRSQMQPRIDLHVGSNVPSMFPRPRTGMWPSHPSQQQLPDEQIEKQREYLKQQQKLRLLTASTPQAVSADALIENLLGKKETFKPKTSGHGSVPGAAPTSQNMMSNIGIPVQVPGMVTPHMSTSVRPEMGFPVSLPATSSSANMMGGYGAPALPPDIKGSYPTASKAYPTASQMDVNASMQTQFPLALPAWLTSSSPLLPQFYRQVWKMVGQEKGLVDTTRIFPLLLTSGLPTDVLGFIWGLANRKIAGQLTEQELYVVLALVALAQSGCTFNNLSVLNLIPQPPIPNLKITSFDSMTSMPSRELEAVAPPMQGKMKREELNLHLVSSNASGFPTQSSVCDDTGLDEFTDFQSAVTTGMEQTSSKPETESMSSSTITEGQKCPSVMVVGSGHGRGVGSRLANHSLGTPKQKKIKHHHHHHHHHHHRGQSQMMANFTPSGDEDFSEFQQARDSAASIVNSGDDMFPKCLVKPPPQGKTYLLKESAIRTEVNQQTVEPLKDVSGLLPLEELHSTQLEESKPGQKTLLKEPQIVLGLENATSVPALKQAKSEGVNLISIEEDKYSALRNLSLVDKETNSEKPPLLVGPEESPASDDFGDFLSAEPLQGVDDSFADIATREQTPSGDLVDVNTGNIWKTHGPPQAAEFQVDDWGEYETAPTLDGRMLNSANETKWSKQETDISASFMDLNLDSDKSNTCDSKIDIDFAGVEKETAAVGESSSGNTWDLRAVGDSRGETSARTEHSSSFQGFLGKIYDGDVKTDDYSSKIDVFCSSPDDQLRAGYDIDVQTRDGDDDFGDFVGPDAWSEEQKYSAMTKDILFEGHLYGDSQSVSSLELPPLALSRHGSVPSLDLKIFPSAAEKNGGNGGNQPWDLSPQGIEHQLSEWQRCLQSCLTLLQSAVETFRSISCGDVLDEVLGSAEGKDYLQNLLEVAGVSHRVECSFKQLGNSGEYKQLDTLLADIDCAWSSLESYYMKAEIPIDLESDLLASATDGGPAYEASVCCGVCLVDVGSGTKTESNRNTSQLEYGGHIYHSVCANLWVNCVDSSLPALAIGSSGFL